MRLPTVDWTTVSGRTTSWFVWAVFVAVVVVLRVFFGGTWSLILVGCHCLNSAGGISFIWLILRLMRWIKSPVVEDPSPSTGAVMTVSSMRSFQDMSLYFFVHLLF